MRARIRIGRGPRSVLLLVGTAATVALGHPGSAAAAPAPCRDQPQITDAAGDGHHPNEDVLAAWFSEAAGRVQAVIQVREAAWEPAHDDSDDAVFAFLFTAGGQTRYVRALAPRGAAPAFDFGTWSLAGGYVSGGATTGVVVPGANGTATFDVPAAAGATPGAVLSAPFVLTSDGSDLGGPHWVDRAPGGTGPTEAAFGADYVVGSCTPAATPVPPAVPGAPLPPVATTPAPAAVRTTAVSLRARSRLVGGGTIKVAGSVTPPRAGVTVTLAAAAARTTRKTLTTAADGSFSTSLRVDETTDLRATAEGIGSTARIVTVASTVRMRIAQARAGARVRVTGTVSPRLPGRVLLLRTTSARPSATATVRAGRFSFSLSHPRRGRYQVVFVPSGDRAERSTSTSGAIK